MSDDIVWHQYVYDKDSEDHVVKNIAIATEALLIAVSRTKNKEGLYEMKRISPEVCHEEIKNIYLKLYKEAN